MSDSERITVTDEGAAMLAADQRARPADLLFRGRQEALEARECIFCGAKAIVFRNQNSAREYEISALCQDCQDEVFG